MRKNTANVTNVNEIVRIEQYSRMHGVCTYNIFGLNIFVINSSRDRNLYALKNYPFFIFIESLISKYNCAMLIGAPGLQNLLNEYSQSGKSQRELDLLTENLPKLEIPMWYYGGEFGFTNTYGVSTLVYLSSINSFRKVFVELSRWDAICLICYPKETQNILERSRNYFETFQSEDSLFKGILTDAKYIILTQDDGQYLEVTMSCDNQDEKEISDASQKAREIIIENEWFKRNIKRLVWDNSEMTLVFSS